MHACAPPHPVSTYAIQIRTTGLCLMAMLGGCTGQAHENAGQDMPQVRIAVASESAPQDILSLPARVAPGLQVSIHARATGLVAQRYAGLGDSVKAGQVLAVIHAPEVDQAVRQAQAQRLQAAADLKLARSKYERTKGLVGSSAISKEQHEEREGAYEVARASLAAADARLANLHEQQSFQRVRAPIAGTITARHIEQGDRTIADQGAASQPLFELSTLDPLRVLVDVPQSAAMSIAKGQRASLRLAGSMATDKQAEVVRWSRRITQSTGGMRVELSLPNASGDVSPGMTGQLQLHLKQAHRPTLVPVSTLIQDGASTQVARLSSDNRIDLQPVTLGRNLGQRVEILHGISVGDRVVINPNAMLKPDMQVSISASDGQ